VARISTSGGSGLAGQHRVEVGVEGDHAVLAGRAKVPLGDDVGSARQWPQSDVVTDRTVADDLAVRVVDPRAPQRHPRGERGVEFLDRGKGPAGQDVVADDADLPLDPAFALRAVGGQDVEAVVAREADRLRAQWDGLTRGDVAADHGLGAVVDDRHLYAAEVGERLAVAVEERCEDLAGGEAAERVTRVRQRHVEGVDLRDAHVGEDLAFVTPVHLGLRAGDDLEPTVQARQFAGADAQFFGDAGPGFLKVELHALVGAGEPVLADQPFVDHRALDEDLGPQHRIDQRRDRGLR